MERKAMPADEIRKSIQEVVNKDQNVVSDGADIEIGDPYRHEPDDSGCNWNIRTHRNATGYEPVVDAAVFAARRQFNLED